MSRIGLIAGNRKLPLIFACEATKRDYSVIAIAIRGETHSSLGNFVEKVYWLNLNEFSKIFEVFRNENITEVVMAGQISPHQLFRPQVKNSSELRSILDSLKDKRADTIFRAIAERLEERGIRVLNSTFLLDEFYIFIFPMPKLNCIKAIFLSFLYSF